MGAEQVHPGLAIGTPPVYVQESYSATPFQLSVCHVETLGL
jgi:hypothetical protein